MNILGIHSSLLAVLEPNQDSDRLLDKEKEGEDEEEEAEEEEKETGNRRKCLLYTSAG